MPDYSTPQFYRAIARAADRADRLGHGEHPIDLPDYDWPDAPEPDYAALKRESLADQHKAAGGSAWILACIAITASSLIYLATQVHW